MRRSNLFWGAIIILIGVLLLIGKAFKVDVWQFFWPLLLVAVGLWVLLGATVGRRPLETEEVSIPLSSAIRTHLRLRHGAGRLRVGAGAPAGTFLSGTFAGGVSQQVGGDEDLLRVHLGIPDRTVPHVIFPWHWGGGLDWTITLNEEVPITLDLKGGAGETRLDLEDLQVTELRLETGVSSTRITLPANAGHTDVRAEAGVGEVTLRVPEGVAAQIRIKSGLSGIHVNRSRFPRQGNVYRSPDYDSAENKVDIRVEAGLGAINIH